MFNSEKLDSLELLAASASEIHSANERGGKLRVEFKSDEDRTRKRQLRLLKNRQSAALSRQRKKEYINDLEERTNGLITENNELAQRIAKLSSLNTEFKSHIDTLEKNLTDTKNENSELRSRLATVTGSPSTSSSSSSPSSSASSSSPTTTSPSSSTTTTSTSTFTPPSSVPSPANTTPSPHTDDDAQMESPPITSHPPGVQQSPTITP